MSDEMDLAMRQLNDALRMRCRRCDGMHLTQRQVDVVLGLPIYAYTCRDCGHDSADSGEPKTTDYCVRCGESPESGSHLPHGHAYIDPRVKRCLKPVHVDEGWPPGKCVRRPNHAGLCDVYREDDYP